MLFVGLSGAALARADEVRLKSGGRVRGNIMEEDPTTGVKIQMADGTIRTIEASEVQRVIYDEPKSPEDKEPLKQPPSHPETATGQIRITSDEDGTVYRATPLRLGRRKKFGPHAQVGAIKAGEPFTLTAPEGMQLVEVEFDQGGSDAELVTVGPDSSIELHGLEYWHGGPRAWVGAGVPAFWAFFGEHTLIAFDFEFQAALALPVSHRVSLRTGLRLGGGPFNSEFTFGVDAGARFSLTSVYGMELGVDGGLFYNASQYPIATSPAGYLGPRVSLLSLRLGPHRNAELALRDTIPVLLHPGANVTAGLSVELSFAVMAFGD
ncbi:MAG: hypothetical protein U0271_39170 [Polyangiaceae bacterium]